MIKANLKGAKALKAIRRKMKLTQDGLGRILQTNLEQMQLWERGWQRVPEYVLVLANLAQVLPKVRKILEAWAKERET